MNKQTAIQEWCRIFEQYGVIGAATMPSYFRAALAAYQDDIDENWASYEMGTGVRPVVPSSGQLMDYAARLNDEAADLIERVGGDASALGVIVAVLMKKENLSTEDLTFE